MAETSTAAQATEAATPDEKNAGFRRKLIGIIRSSKMDKTVIVEVLRRTVHGKYHKYVKTRERYMAHDETNEFSKGDKVEIRENRPLSKQKRWVVTRLIAAKK